MKKKKNSDANTETDPLTQDVEQFQEEKERVRKIIGQIGGTTSRKGESFAHYLLIFLLVALFALALLHHLADVNWTPDPLLLLELGVFLVSIKIIWMLHKQTRVAHFQFWILNTLEFRLMDTSKRIERMEKYLRGNEEKKEETGKADSR